MKKIGILTLHNSFNYGALLQSYATYKYLSKNNNVIFINYQNSFEKKYNKLFCYRRNISFKQNIYNLIKNIVFKSHYWCKKSFKKFINEFKKTKVIKNNNLMKYDFDVILSGSDQIWNPSIFGDVVDDKYLLNFKTNAKKISYASSFGSYIITKNTEKIFINNLSKYKKISVREEYAAEMLNNILKKDIKVVCDPTMLLDKNDWNKFCDVSSKKIPKEKYILVYLMSKYEEYEKLISRFAKENNYKIAFITFSDIKRKNVDYYLKGLTPEEFVLAIKNAEVIMTNSFHGTIFSLMLNKEFYNLFFDKNPLRSINLLKQFNLNERCIKDYNDILKCKKINYDEINKKIKEISDDSKFWLDDAIGD